MTSPSRISTLFYYNFRRYYRYRHWLLRRFTKSGQFTLAALLISAVVGINTQQVVAYQIFGLMAALLLLALAYVAVFKPVAAEKIAIERPLPRYATVGEEVTYRLRLRHLSGSAIGGLSLLESHHDPRPTLIQFSQAHEPGSERQNRYDRMVGYYRWSWLVRMNAVAQIDEIHVPSIQADATQEFTQEVTQRFTPRFRGQLNLSGLALARRDPLGLCRATREIALPASMLVLPRTYTLPPLDLPGQLHHQPEHRVSAAASGDGEEIAGLREYRPGDALRDIHWKSFARSGIPVVKQYQSEYFERHALLLDTIGAPEGAAFEEAVSLAASFVGNLHGNDGLLDLLFVGVQCHCFTMGPGELQAEALMRVLALVKPCPDESLAALQASVLSRRAELSSCICILLDWDAERRQMVAELLQSGLALLVFLVSEVPLVDCPTWLHQLVPGRMEEGLGRI